MLHSGQPHLTSSYPWHNPACGPRDRNLTHRRPNRLHGPARRKPAHRTTMAGGGSDPGIRLASPAKSLVHSYRHVTGRYRPPANSSLKDVCMSSPTSIVGGHLDLPVPVRCQPRYEASALPA